MPDTAYKQCETCGKDYRPYRKDQRYCSAACHRKWRPRAERMVTVACTGCGAPTLKEPKELRRYPPYCSKGCASRARILARQPQRSMALVGPVPRRAPKRPKPTATKSRRWIAGPCGECGQSFTAPALGRARYCSFACLKRNHRRRDKKARSRRIQAGANREVVDLATVARRDGWRCHICRLKVTREDWSLDHLIPLSHGGEHTYANVALAHHRCNARRGATGPAQLRLAA